MIFRKFSLWLFLTMQAVGTMCIYAMDTNNKEPYTQKEIKEMHNLIDSNDPNNSKKLETLLIKYQPHLVNEKLLSETHSVLWKACCFYSSSKNTKHLNDIKILLKQHEVICNEQLHEGDVTPLIWMSQYDVCEVIIPMVLKKADPHQTYVSNYEDSMEEKDKEHFCAMNSATGNGHKKVVQFFLNRPNYDINATNVYYTPIYYATNKKLFDHEKNEMLDLFLEKKANPNICGTKGKNAIIGAIIDKNIKALKHLDKYIDWTWKSQSGDTYLHWACASNSKKVFKYIVEKIGNSIDFNTKTSAGLTPAFSATEAECLENIKFLYDQGADLTLVDNLGQNILMIATMYENFDIVDYLLKLSKQNEPLFDLEVKDIYGCTALHYAADSDNPLICSLILKKAPHLENQNNFGNETPTSLAKKNKNVQIKMLFPEKPQSKKNLNKNKKKSRKNKKNKAITNNKNNNQSEQKEKTIHYISENQKNLSNFLDLSTQNSDQEEIGTTPKDLKIDDRCSQWFNNDFLIIKKNELGNSPLWLFEQSRRYHQIPKEVLEVISLYGERDRFPSTTKQHSYDIQMSLFGIMQFEDVNKNPWNPGYHQCGIYHFTRGTNGTIYHVGFTILRRGFEGLDKSLKIPFQKTSIDEQKYQAFWVPEENKNGVRHVLFLDKN